MRIERAPVEFLERLEVAVTLARMKHPEYAEGKYQALGVIRDEVSEFTRAVEKETDIRSVEEAWDVIATCARYILGEHNAETGRVGYGWENEKCA